MIPFDQQLRSIVAAVSFASPQVARVTNLNGAQREVAVAGERDAFGGLAVALYADHYCLLPGNAGQAAAVDGTAFLAALRAAKALIAGLRDGDPAPQSLRAAEALAERRASDEGREGIAAFLERRDPSW